MTFAELQEKHGTCALEACRELLDELRIQEFGDHPFRETVLDAFAHGIIFARERDAVPQEPTGPKPEEKPADADYIIALDCQLDYEEPVPAYYIYLPNDECGIAVHTAQSIPGYIDTEGEMVETEDGIQIVVPRRVIFHRKTFEAAMARYQEVRDEEKKQRAERIKSQVESTLKSILGDKIQVCCVGGIASKPTEEKVGASDEGKN